VVDTAVGLPVRNALTAELVIGECPLSAWVQAIAACEPLPASTATKLIGAAGAV
jgi:hypothetical protein